MQHTTQVGAQAGMRVPRATRHALHPQRVRKGALHADHQRLTGRCEALRGRLPSRPSPAHGRNPFLLLACFRLGAGLFARRPLPDRRSPACGSLGGDHLQPTTGQREVQRPRRGHLPLTQPRLSKRAVRRGEGHPSPLGQCPRQHGVARDQRGELSDVLL